MVRIYWRDGTVRDMTLVTAQELVNTGLFEWLKGRTGNYDSVIEKPLKEVAR